MSEMVENGRPIVLRGGTVLTMNDAHDVLHDADVLVEGDKIAAVGARSSRCSFPRLLSRRDAPHDTPVAFTDRSRDRRPAPRTS